MEINQANTPLLVHLLDHVEADVQAWLFLPKASKTSTSYRRFQTEHACGAEKAPAPRSVEGRYCGMMNNQLLDERS